MLMSLVTWFQLTKKYGPVFSLYFGGTPAVFIHGFPLVKEVLMIKGTEFAGRPSFPLTNFLTRNKGLLILRYGEAWKEQRRFSLMLLRNFGVGKKSMEAKILEEASYLIQVFAENINMPFDPNGFLDTAVANIMSTILFAKHFEYDNSFLKTMLDMIHQKVRILAGPWALIYNEVPLVRCLPLPHQELFTITKKLDDFLEKEIEEHKATLTPGEPRDFIDAYLEEIQKSAHCDESQWKFPNEFNPSNFLNEEGEFVKPEAFMPFSAGPRVCLGENLARMELFLFFTSILRNFQLSWPDKSQAPDFTPHFGVTQSPSRFKVLLKCRQPNA
ncbi:cytochrome P450 2F2-like [Vipera latastei]